MSEGAFTFFYTDASPFSQWHRCRFDALGHTFGCAEQYMMHGKAVLDVGCGGGILAESMALRGADVLGIDLSVKPQENFFLYANGGWQKANPIPAAYSAWGAFNEVDEHNKTALHKILEHAATVEKPGSIEFLVVGTGEQINALVPFDAETYANSLFN